jgi:hypothetical protein
MGLVMRKGDITVGTFKHKATAATGNMRAVAASVNK